MLNYKQSQHTDNYNAYEKMLSINMPNQNKSSVFFTSATADSNLKLFRMRRL